ncbi:MAG: lysophospholipase [Holophagales bacterium]|nr:lysophospholipase [Holophagales bacterium]MYF94251.1 lysophospholipase [Holophagales bacterium]
MIEPYDRIPFPVFFREEADFGDVYGGPGGFVFFDGHLLRPRERASRTVVIFNHPIGGGAWLPLVRGLAAAGHHVIYCNGRYRGNDTALIMEKCVVDLGRTIQHAKEELGYERVLLGGWSGGGSLSLYYQQQAENQTVTHTPAGDPYDLTAAGLIPADGVMLLAAHISRAGTLTEWMDASILDEREPHRKDPELDLYNPDNPNQPPYSDEFLERYRQAQVARNARITAWAVERLAELKRDDGARKEHCFVVQGTMADPRWLDPAVDPNGRAPGRCYLGDPETVNTGPTGLARFTTLRSWLSQWSLEKSNADGLACAADISVPVLVVNNGADDACTPSHARRLYAAVSHTEKEFHEIAGATHYYLGQGDKLAEAVAICGDWIDR